MNDLAVRSMSLVGHSRPFELVSTTSALPRPTDIIRTRWHVSNVQNPKFAASFDHLVGASEEARRNFETRRLRAFRLITSSNLVGRSTGNCQCDSPASKHVSSAEGSFKPERPRGGKPLLVRSGEIERPNFAAS